MEFNKPRGTRDFLFEDMEERKYVENTIRSVVENYGFKEIKTPIFEDLELFTTKSGEGIKEEIYHFQDKGGRDLALRPELTASVSRLYNNNLQKAVKPLKMYYFGSCFRYERPQAGRFRQFWQFGIEVIGGTPVYNEAEIIAMANEALTKVGIKNYEVAIGHLGIIKGVLNHLNVNPEDTTRIIASIESEIISDVKSQMESETMQLFNDLVWKENTYGRIEFDDNFRLNLFSKGSDISCIDTTSAAERELLALAFTIALHRVSGHDSPLFIDTPVGRVSDNNRENFAKTLVDVSTQKQIVLAFTPSEYSEEIKGFFNQQTLSTQVKLVTVGEEITEVEDVQ